MINCTRPGLITFSLILFFCSCTQSDEQREFEEKALSLPENITETADNGAIVDNNTDPDDWRIAPFFQGVIQVDPPFPNPLLTTQQLTININAGIDAASALRILVLYNERSLRVIYPSSPLPSGTTVIYLSALDIARFNENAEGLYRVIIEDGDENIITYGDIKIK